jgi:hypothetical protein
VLLAADPRAEPRVRQAKEQDDLGRLGIRLI